MYLPTIMDYECRNLKDLDEVGTPKYARTCKVMALGYRIRGLERKVFRPGYDPIPEDLLYWLNETDEPIWAHNAAFEREVTEHAVREVVPEFPVHRIPANRWRCSAVLASYFGYPRKLDQLGPALRLVARKDALGHKAMLRCSQPDENMQLRERPTPYALQFADYTLKYLRYHLFLGDAMESLITLAERSGVKLPKSPKKRTAEVAARWWLNVHNTTQLTPEDVIWALDWAQMFVYCGIDIDTQFEVVTALPPAPERIWDNWLIDQKINQRGCPVDVTLAAKLSEYNRSMVARLCDQLPLITNGYVTSPNQVQKIKEWLIQRTGFEFKGLAKEDLAEYLEAVETGKVQQDDVAEAVVLARQQGGKTSASKFDKILTRAMQFPDGTIRIADAMVYMAAHTGRWASYGIQIHNLPQAKFKSADKKQTGPLITAIADAMSTGDPATILSLVTTEPMQVLSTWIRSCFIAGDADHELIIIDFSGVECRMLAWLVRCLKLLQIFADKRDPYVELAVQIYNIAAELISKESQERKIGKAGVLGLGYQMGAKTFHDTVWKNERIDLSPEMTKRVVDTYRQTFPEIPRFWYGIEAAVIRAIENPREVHFYGMIKCRVVTRGKYTWLQILLPSGRTLNYAEPSVAVRHDTGRQQIFYWGLHNGAWYKQDTYGGKLTENIIQAICADLLMEALVRFEFMGHEVVLHIHDEVVLRVKKGSFDVHAAESIMSELPDWAQEKWQTTEAGQQYLVQVAAPIGAEGFKSSRYRK